MKRNRLFVVCVVLVAFLGVNLGCSRGPSEEELKLAAFQEQAAAMKAAYDEMLAMREQIAADRALVAELEELGEAKLSDEQKTQLAEAKARLEGADEAAEAKFEEVQGMIADVLNVGINDYPDSQETADALVIYADEAILVADDMVAKSGDYKKAIDHLRNVEGYFQAAGLSSYHPLVAKIAELEEWRFVTKERFDQVTKGMTKEEVVAVVGQVYYRNVQESPSKGVETWLYKKREGGAAAFYFKIRTGKLYDKNWDAVAVKAVSDD